MHETRTRSPTETNEPPRLSARNGTLIEDARAPCSRAPTIGADFDGEAVRFCGSASGTSRWGNASLAAARVCEAYTPANRGGPRHCQESSLHWHGRVYPSLEPVRATLGRRTR